MQGKEIKGNIYDYIEGYTNNKEIKTRWRTPLVAFAKADDPLFFKLKEIVSPTHLMPQDLLAAARSVIVYFIPFAEDINLGNKAGKEASKDWALAYIETNKLITDLNDYLLKLISEKGHSAQVIPPTHNFNKESLLSNWSHKHVGYIAGLGTFGMHQMLITQRGSSGRLGSIVTSLELEPSTRPLKEYCLYKAGKHCLKCVEKCPTGALQRTEYDRHKCYEVCLSNAKTHAAYGLADVCGKCVSGVPCAFRNPEEAHK